MAVYREDPDLDFLPECDNQDLNVLVTYLTKGKDGDPRWGEELTCSGGYKKYHPDHKRYWKDIAAELQTYAGNSFANVLRGEKGVLYRRVLVTVAKRMKVNFNRASSVEVIEMNLLMKVLTDSMEKMTQKELNQLIKTTGIKTTKPTAEAVTAALQILIRKSGFAAYKVALIVANAVAKAILGRGLSLATNAALVRAISVFAGPIGWAITGLWTLIDLAGPAYRVIIPCTIHVAYMRAKLAARDMEEG
jgi:uncharacterized protein YaaW (UPF0174 family)